MDLVGIEPTPQGKAYVETYFQENFPSNPYKKRDLE